MYRVPDIMKVWNENKKIKGFNHILISTITGSGGDWGLFSTKPCVVIRESNCFKMCSTNCDFSNGKKVSKLSPVKFCLHFPFSLYFWQKINAIKMLNIIIHVLVCICETSIPFTFKTQQVVPVLMCMQKWTVWRWSMTFRPNVKVKVWVWKFINYEQMRLGGRPTHFQSHKFPAFILLHKKLGFLVFSSAVNTF